MSEATTQSERKKYKLTMDDHYSFNPIGEFKLLPSTELGRLAYPIFKAAFADFEGMIFEYNNGNPSMSLLFNHGKYDDEVVGVKRTVEGKNNSDSVLERTRFRDNVIRYGDRYYITDDLKDVIEYLLTNQAYNNGKPKWGTIVTEYSENRGWYQPNATQYTKVSQISLNRLASLLFGRKDPNTDDKFDYEVRLLGSLNTIQGMPASDYMLQITKASTNEVNEVYKKLGFSMMSSNIIRG